MCSLSSQESGCWTEVWSSGHSWEESTQLPSYNSSDSLSLSIIVNKSTEMTVQPSWYSLFTKLIAHPSHDTESFIKDIDCMLDFDFFYFYLYMGFTMQPRLTLNSWSSCFRLLNPVIMGHLTWQTDFFSKKILSSFCFQVKILIL
jgi:hypothetical protein